jgi:hypothetical protein
MATQPNTRGSTTLRNCRLLEPAAVNAARVVPEPAAFVIRALDLHRRADLPPGLPEPIGAEWINRGTGQRLRPNTIAMLLRTLPRREKLSSSAARLQQEAGLRMGFASSAERHTFARTWLELVRHCQAGSGVPRH